MRIHFLAPRQMADVMRCIFATLGLLNTSAGQESECAWTLIYFPLFFNVLQICNSGSDRVKAPAHILVYASPAAR